MILNESLFEEYTDNNGQYKLEESLDQEKSEIYYRFEVFDHNNRKISGGLFRGLNKFLEKLYREDDSAYEDLNYWVAHLEYVTPFPENFNNNKAKFAYKESFVNKYKDHFDKISELLDDLDWELLDTKVQVKNSDVVYEDDVQIAYTKGISLTEAKKKRKKKIKTNYNLPQSKFKTVDDILKFHKKRQKGQGTFVTYDVGNMEYNNSLFNRAMGSGDAITSVGNSADASVASSSGVVGMGESLQQLNEEHKLSPRYAVKQHIEKYIDLLEQDPIQFITEAISNRHSYNLDEGDISNLLRILHQINIDVNYKIAEDCGYDYYFTNYSSEGTEQDYLSILEDVVKQIPNKYIDKKYFDGYTAQEVMDALTYELKWDMKESYMPEDVDSDVEGIRVECYIDGMSGPATYRNIGIQIIVSTAYDAGVIQVQSFASLLLHSLGYFVNTIDANIKMNDYVKRIIKALQNIIKE